MTNIVAVLIVRCTHTGVYADGRSNTGSVTIYDLDETSISKTRSRYVPIPPGATVDIPMSTRTFVSWHSGDICKFTVQGLIRSEIILQLRDKSDCGGPAGTGQALRPAVSNVERVNNVLRLVLPDNIIPTTLETVGFMVGEPVEITGLSGAFRELNGNYVISAVGPGTGLGGADAGSYLVEVPSQGSNIAADTLAGVNVCLTEGRVTAQFNSAGDVGGFGSNIFGYIGGQLFPNAGGGGGGGALSVEDEGILIDASTTLMNFVGAGVTVTSTGAGGVEVSIPGGGGAPDDAQYIVLAASPSLTDERVLTAGLGIGLFDAGAGDALTISVTAGLADVLGNGNETGGSDLVISTGDSIIGQTDLILEPGGAGDILVLDGLTWPSADGNAGEAIVTDGFGVLSFAAPAPALHGDTHVRSGADPVDGDLIDIDFVPTNYTRTVGAPTTSVEELTSHLRGIDDAFGDVSGSVEVYDEGVLVDAGVTSFDFTGAGVTVTSPGAGSVEVFVPGGGGSTTVAYTTDVDVTAGDLVALNDSGNLVHANSLTSLGFWDVLGVAQNTATTGQVVQVIQDDGVDTLMRFANAPLASDIGKVVFLSPQDGTAQIGPPSPGASHTFVVVGDLKTANGMTTTPQVVYRRQVIASVTGTAGGSGPGTPDASLDATFSYDSEGRLEEITYSDLSVKTLTYNAEGQLITVFYLGETKTLTYNPDGTLATVTYS